MPTDEFPSPADISGERAGALATAFSFRTYIYRENLLAEFERLVTEGKLFDGLIVDLSQVGFSLSLETLVKFNAYARRLLKPQGVLLFIKPDAAVTLSRDDPAGGLSFTVYDSPFGIFARYPMLADYACATVSGIDRRRLRGGGSTLANHILYTSTLVLTEKGTRLKDSFELPAPQNWVIQLIDDYSSVESVSRTMEKEHGVAPDETLRILQELEADGAIFPVFPRIQFLSNCYHNRKPFRLGRYMVAAGILTAAQLQELLEIQQEEGWGRNQRTFLGLLAVRHGYINTRQLEVLLNDQYLYGGYHRVAEADEAGVSRTVNIETMRDSMIGSLGAIDSAGLLQSLSTAKKTGVLTVENRDRTLVISFSEGRPTHARLGKLSGYAAIAEFLVTWCEGIFVFRDKAGTTDLDESCALDQSLDRLLLDAALYQDQSNQTLSQLPLGRNTVLERVWNFDALWQKAAQSELSYGDGSAVSRQDREHIAAIARLLDGLSTVDEVIRNYDCWPAHMVVRSLQLLIGCRLAAVQQTGLFRPLAVFQKVASDIGELVGLETNKALLEASLHYVHGNSPAAQRFHIDHEGRVSVNLAQVKRSGVPVSSVLLEMRRFLEAYLAYARRQVDPHLVNNIVARVVHGSI
ncbi:MAG TPA: DUF4388 domain-containing protein [Candidatus Obscuribacterales bacterium]